MAGPAPLGRILQAPPRPPWPSVAPLDHDRGLAAGARTAAHIYVSLLALNDHKHMIIIAFNEHIYMLFWNRIGHINMNADQAILARKQLERRLAPLREAKPVVPPRGWIRAIRESIGMTTRQFAARMGVGPSRIPVIEKAEITGATTIKTLRDAAEALNCTFVYAFVPVKPLDEILHDRATLKVRQDIARLDHTMQLENQALLKADLKEEQQRMVASILSGSLRGLWDDEHDSDA
jgi:predicted DNA-binding mobile mystery protein A